MGETTKQERDQVFKRLRGIGPNKVKYTNYDVHVCTRKGQSYYESYLCVHHNTLEIFL